MLFYAALVFLIHLHHHGHIAARISKRDVAGHSVISVIDHDHNCYTQGLTFNEGFLYESCGINGKSSVRKVNPRTGEVLQHINFQDDIFAEGLVVIKDHIYVLTWTNKIMLVINKLTFELIGKYRYQTHTGEGWGLAYDGKQFIVSDGSSRITFFDVPDINKLSSSDISSTVLKKTRTIIVRDSRKKEIKLLNELEWTDNGYLYSNVWYKDFILRINIDNGNVDELIDLHSLYPYKTRSKNADCLNGIAHNSTDNTFLLTGKLWPKYYKIKIIPSQVEFTSRIENISGGSSSIDL